MEIKKTTLKKLSLSLFLFLAVVSLFILVFARNNDKSSPTVLSAQNENQKTIKTLSVQDFRNKIDDKSTILDVRTPHEYEAGHLQNAINIDFHSTNLKEKFKGLDADKTYLIYCSSGNRSSSALKIMDELGFSEVYDLKNGLNNWQAVGNTVCTNC